MSNVPWDDPNNEAELKPATPETSVTDSVLAGGQFDKTPSGRDELHKVFETPEQQEERRLLNAKIRLENKQFKRDMRNREEFAQGAFGITQAWIGFLFVLTTAQFGLKSTLPGLTQTEFVTVFTTTTASVFGFWLLVGRYLFKPHDVSETEKAKKRGKRDVKKMLAKDE